MSLGNKGGQVGPSNASGHPFVVVLIRIEEAVTSEDLVRFPIRAMGLHGADVKDLTGEVVHTKFFDVG